MELLEFSCIDTSRIVYLPVPTYHNIIYITVSVFQSLASKERPSTCTIVAPKPRYVASVCGGFILYVDCTCIVCEQMYADCIFFTALYPPLIQNHPYATCSLASSSKFRLVGNKLSKGLPPYGEGAL